LDAAARRAEHELDGADGARREASSVADAVGGAHESRLAVDEAEHVVLGLFGTHLDAGPAADALERVDDGMQRWRLDEACRSRVFAHAEAALVQAASAPRKGAEHDERRYEVDEHFHRRLRLCTMRPHAQRKL